MKQKYSVTVSSSEINFYARNDMMDKIFSESFDDAFRKIESHDKLVKALEGLEREGWLHHIEQQGESISPHPVAKEIFETVKRCREALAAAKGE